VPGAELQRAAHIIRDGGIVAYATEYCFGLGCDPRNRDAVLRILRLKRRPVSKGLILLAGDVAQLTPFVADIPAAVLKTWPGPHTWLVAPSARVPKWITGAHPRVAVRVTAHAQAAMLCRLAKTPIVSTSTNRAGETPARTHRDVLRRFDGLVDYVLPGAVGESLTSTPIRDSVTNEMIRD
jgi:L-threonylcarbamoyladenylate synthase